MIGIIKSLTLIITLAYIGFGLLLFVKQRDLLYLPTPEVPHLYNEKIFVNEGESIKVVALNQHNDNAILYFGGNAEPVERNAKDFIDIFPKYAIYLVKYRGYGGSTGRPEEQALYSDALHIFDQIKNNYDSVSVVGRSLGSGVATLLAVERSIHRLALITPFDSVESVAQRLYPLYPISFLLKDKYDSLSRVEHIKVPTLIIIAEDDQIIKKEHALRLAKQFSPAQTTIEILKNTGHNNLNYNGKYLAALQRYFKQ